MMKRAVFLALLILGGTLGAVAAPSSLAFGPAWSRPAIGTGVVYLTIDERGTVADRLLAAASPVARAVELHQSFATHAPMRAMPMSGMAMDDVMSMRRVPSVTVPAHGRVRFGPGGYHIMLIGLRHDLQANETFPLRLRFARAGWISVSVHVRTMDE
jgi:copper(I)-binding protein